MPIGASGGASVFRRIGTASTNAAVVKASSGVLYGVSASNVNAAAVYLKIYDKATAPTVGTDVPKFTILCGGATTGTIASREITTGVAFTSGIAIAITGVVTDADATAVLANEQVVHVIYR